MGLPLWGLGFVVLLLRVMSAAQQPSYEGLSPLAAAVRETTWASYAPTNFDPAARPPMLPTDQSIRADLRVLRDAGFDGLITYSDDVPSVRRLAEEAGFRYLLLGIWDPLDAAELDRTRVAARSERVLGLIVGNEGLTVGRYDLPGLRRAMKCMRRATGKPVSTTEVVDLFFSTPELIDLSDLLTVNAHPYFQQLHDPRRAVEWTLRLFDRLTARAEGKPVLFKEVGLPTGGNGRLSEDAQFNYYDGLSRTRVVFAYFEAFDALFKQGPIEQSWGLFYADRTPKRAAEVVKKRSLRP